MEIECNFEEFDWYDCHEQNSLIYTCVVTSANILNRAVEIRSFKGEHEDGQTNADVKAILFREAKVEYFPRKLHEIFPNLTHLEISDSGFKTISAEDLIGLENLLEFSIINTDLTTLPDDLFANMPNLKAIWFSNNKIEFATSKLLKPFIGRSIDTFQLDGNTAIDEYYVANHAKTLEGLMKMIDEKCKKPKKKLQNFNEKRSNYFTDLWRTGRFSDFTVSVGDRSFRAHKSILSLNSSVFANVFEVESQVSEMRIRDFSEASVENLLSFFYTGEYDDENNVIESFLISEKFNVEDLKTIFKDILLADETKIYEAFIAIHQSAADESFKRKFFLKVKSVFPKSLPDKILKNPLRLQKLIEAMRFYEQ